MTTSLPTGDRERGPAPGAQPGFEPGSAGQSSEPVCPAAGPQLHPLSGSDDQQPLQRRRGRFPEQLWWRGGAVLWDVSGARDCNHTAGTRGPALHPSSAVQHRGTLRRAGMEPRAHSPTRVPLSYHENGSVITVYGFQWWFRVQVGWLALPRKSTRITIYKAWFGEMHASSVFQKTGARIQTLIETKMWPKLNVVLSLITT